MKKKIIVIIVSFISLIGVGIGGFSIGRNSDVIEKPIQVETEYVPLQQALYGCPISKKIKQKKYLKK